jgi:hypothetical protein
VHFGEKVAQVEKGGEGGSGDIFVADGRGKRRGISCGGATWSRGVGEGPAGDSVWWKAGTGLQAASVGGAVPECHSVAQNRGAGVADVWGLDHSAGALNQIQTESNIFQ